MSMHLLERKARELSKEEFPGLPPKEKTVLDREVITYLIVNCVSMPEAFERVTQDKKDYYRNLSEEV